MWFHMTTPFINNCVPAPTGKGDQTLQTQIIPGGTKEVLQYPEFMGHKEITRVFGLKRSHLYQLKNLGLIKSVALRVGGASKGRRLFYVESIRAFLHANIEEVPAVASVPTKEVSHAR